jgi:hypothetical protein
MDLSLSDTNAQPLHAFPRNGATLMKCGLI